MIDLIEPDDALLGIKNKADVHPDIRVEDVEDSKNGIRQDEGSVVTMGACGAKDKCWWGISRTQAEQARLSLTNK